MSSIRKGIAVKEQMTDELQRTRTTIGIGIRMTTKNKLDEQRAPGQCYDSFICQLVDLWERFKEGKQDYVLNTSKGGDVYRKK